MAFWWFCVPCSAEDYLIETIAGSSQKGDGGYATNSLLNSPFGVAISSSNEIYIADTFNNRIRKISTSGIITTVAGTGSASFSGDGDNATSATLNNPSGIAVSSLNEIYIADTSNHRIRKILTSGIITTVAGTGSASFSGDGGYATSATLNSPRAVVALSNGSLLFTALVIPTPLLVVGLVEDFAYRSTNAPVWKITMDLNVKSLHVMVFPATTHRLALEMEFAKV